MEGGCEKFSCEVKIFFIEMNLECYRGSVEINKCLVFKLGYFVFELLELLK